MLESVAKVRRLPASAKIVLLLAFAFLAAEFFALGRYQLRLPSQDWYLHVNRFGAANRSGAFSHWLDVIIMSGNAVIVAWLLCAEAFFRRSGKMLAAEAAFMGGLACTFVSCVIAMARDNRGGEGTVAMTVVLYFLPMLAASFYLLRAMAGALEWRRGAIIGLAMGFVIFHAVAQFYYEPSESGAPNPGIIPIWLFCMGAALIWSLLEGFRSGAIDRWVGEFDAKIGCERRGTVPPNNRLR